MPMVCHLPNPPQDEVDDIELLQLRCPVCQSGDIHYHTPYITKNHGVRVIYKCKSCAVYFLRPKIRSWKA